VALNGDSAKNSEMYPDFDARVIEPIRNLFRRGIADGAVRDDLPPDVLSGLFSSLVKGALDATTSGRRGIEESAATVTSFFLNGARTTPQKGAA
jgi:TetR/AcrR family transcriptional regulator, mexCD-oprJ operon repressor